jgi:calcineurin-like phosphoesterase family protein
MEYFISDHHFDHENIIDYCNRDFDNINEMNNRMIKIWNKKVNKKDIVYHLGDFTLKGKERANELYNSLNGNIILVRGNHDDFNTDIFPILESLTMERKGIRIECSHRIKNTDMDWILHGHHHNNSLREYPFINTDKNRINVSVELLEYEPISIDEIIKQIKENNKNKMKYS